MRHDLGIFSDDHVSPNQRMSPYPGAATHARSGLDHDERSKLCPFYRGILRHHRSGVTAWLTPYRRVERGRSNRKGATRRGHPDGHDLRGYPNLLCHQERPCTTRRQHIIAGRVHPEGKFRRGGDGDVRNPLDEPISRPLAASGHEVGDALGGPDRTHWPL
jgi:hypothetical protein